MKIECTSKDDFTLVALDGRLDVEGVQQVGDAFSFQVTVGRKPAVVDCSRLSFVASLGIGLLVTAAKALSRSGHKLVLLRPSPAVEETLRTAGIHHLMPIVHDDAAVPAALR